LTPVAKGSYAPGHLSTDRSWGYI